MSKLKAMNAAADRYLSRFSRKQFFGAFVVTTLLNNWLTEHVANYQTFYLSVLAGWFFSLMFVKFETKK